MTIFSLLPFLHKSTFNHSVSSVILIIGSHYFALSHVGTFVISLVQDRQLCLRSFSENKNVHRHKDKYMYTGTMVVDQMLMTVGFMVVWCG